jgi:hypothetical protein
MHPGAWTGLRATTVESETAFRRMRRPGFCCLTVVVAKAAGSALVI